MALLQVPTVTVVHHILDVVPWPPLPTSPPTPKAGHRRQDHNTICGYIGGDIEIPATCEPGSHCVLDITHEAIGCCPDESELCTTGIFTQCIDGNSPPQKELNPYVLTCQIDKLCYQNHFDGGFFQFGCGTASDLATTVIASLEGLTTLERPSVLFNFTATPLTLDEPITIGTKLQTRSISTLPTRSDSSASTKRLTTSLQILPTDAPPAGMTMGVPPTNNNPNQAAIIGGTIGGVALAVVVVGLGFWWRYRANVRKGPEGSPVRMYPSYGNYKMVATSGGGSHHETSNTPIGENYDGRGMSWLWI